MDIQRDADLAPVIEDIRTAGANSLRSIAKELNERGISAPRGGIWSAAQVRAAIARNRHSDRNALRLSAEHNPRHQLGAAMIPWLGLFNLARLYQPLAALKSATIFSSRRK